MSKDSPLLSIIIVTWNTAQITKNCIDSINTHLAGKLSYEIIVADNGSQDNTKELISRLDHVIYFNTGANLGFSKANNLAAQKSNSDLLFFLNSDMELVDSSLLDMIDYYQKNSNIGLIGPQFLNPDLTPQASVFPPQTPINAFKQFYLNQSAYSKYLPSSSQPLSVWSISGGAMLVSRKLFSQVGQWNEAYFMYFEDLDLCRQIRQTKKQIFFYPQFKVIHRHGASGANLADSQNQWRRLIPGSIRYHGYLLHTAINFIIWSGQKWQKLHQKLAFHPSSFS